MRFFPYATLLVAGWVVAAAAPAAAQKASWADVVASRGTEQRTGWLGFGYQISWIQAATSCSPRVVVESVVEGAPAQRAGLEPGDVILAMGGRDMSQGVPLGGVRLMPGDSVRLRVARAGGVREIMAVADLRPARPPVALRRSDGLDASDVPVITLSGDTVMARNVEGWRFRGGYWLAGEDGEARFRRIDRLGGSELDRRVVELLRCAGEAALQAPTRSVPGVQEFQRRADSLRVVIAQRAMAREVPAVPMDPRAPPKPGTVVIAPGARSAGVARVAAETRAPAAVVWRFPGDEPATRSEPVTAPGPAVGSIAGAEVTVLERELASYFRGAGGGLLVLRVETGSPADRAGLRPGDVIIEGAGRRLESVEDLNRLLSRPDPATELRVVRQGRNRLLTLRRG